MAAGNNDTLSQPLMEETTPAKRLRFTTSSNHHPLMLPGDEIHAPPDSIPMDLIAEILARLPVKPLLRFRCVSKSWNALISDPQFAKKQFQTSATDPTRLHLIGASFKSSELHLVDYSLPSVFNSSSPTSSSLLCPRCLEEEEEEEADKCLYYLRGSCHGMLCIATLRTPALLLNPATRMHRKLPSLKRPADYNWVVCGFGYDHLSDSYKVAALFVYLNTYGSTDHGDKIDVMVHTLGTDSWRQIQEFPAHLFPMDPHGKFVSGTLNWLCEYNNLSSWCFVSLDLGTETFQQLLLPDCLADGNSRLTTDVLKGCLCILAPYEWFADVWVMKDYGNNESWTKLLSVPCLEECFGLPRALYISDEDDEILLNYGSCFAVYNSKNVTLTQIHAFKSYGLAVVCPESLISPCF